MPQGNSLIITNSPGSVINWQSFSIASQEITRFLQQSASSAVLNRVISGNPSTILGTLQSNGRVYLINPNGITIGPGGTIDVNGFVASTLNISDADFVAGRTRFTDTPGAGKVVNQGTITTPSGGSVYLIGQNVENQGIIKTPQGQILLAAGKSIELVDAHTPEMRVQITAPEGEALNLGQLLASGGRIGMYAGLVRQGGVASADTAVVGENGKIVFKATKSVRLEPGSRTTANGPTGGSISVTSDTGTAVVAGVVEANGTAGKGGTVEVAAPQGVTVEPTARISANGTEGGTVTLAASAGAVIVAAPVTANASSGRAGEIAVKAATTATLAPTAQLTASGGQGLGVVSVKGDAGVTLAAGSVAQASGAAGGTVSVQAEQGAVEVHGTIEVDATESSGGRIAVAALSDITLGDLSALRAGGRAGGETRVEAREGTLLASGSILAQGGDGTGGRVLLLAPRVGLVRNARINVSGRTGGGEALIGGDLHGDNPDVQNAQRTYVGPDVLITADAIETGNGGKVIIWADDVARFYGNVSARGGVNLGDGGFVEVSGKGSLIFDGLVDASAPNGSWGTLLLDPKFIVVQAGGASYDSTAGTGNNLFGTPNATSTQTISPTSINSANANIVLQANDDVTFTDALSLTNAGRTLTVQAGRSIFINNNISTTNGAISMTANETVANGVVDAQRDAGNAVIAMAAGTTINAGSANITLVVGTGPTTNNASGDITLANLTTTGHALVVNNGPTAGSGIVRADATQIITAASAALDVNGAGGGGEIGAAAAPVRVAVTNVAARGQSGGVFVDSPTQGVTIGGATLGGLTGISTTGGGSVAVSANGALAVNEAIDTTVGGATGAAVNLRATQLSFNSGIATIVAAGTGDVTLTTKDTTAAIGVGDSSKTFNATDAMLDQISAGSVVFGEAAHSGGITIATDAAITQNKSLAFRTTGNTVLNGNGITTTNNGAVSFNNFNTAGNTASGALTLNGDIAANGAVSQVGATGVTIGGAGTRTITTTADNVSFANAVTLNQALSISTAGSGAGAGDITFAADVNGAKTLTLNAAAANAALGNAGNTAELAGLTVTANQLTLNGNISVDGGGAVDLSAVPLVVLGANVVIDTDKANAGTTAAGNMLFGAASTIKGDVAGRTLTLDASASDAGGVFEHLAGNVSLGVVGASTELGALTVIATTATLNGNISVDGGGAVDLQRVGAVVLGGNVTIDTDRADAGTTAGGNILFGNATTINGNATGRTLTLDTSATDTGGAANTAGSVNLGVLGNTTELGALTVKAGTLTLNNNISVDGGGAVDFSNTGTVVLATNVVIDSDALLGTTPAGNILFGTSVIRGDGVSPRTLTLDARREDDGPVAGTGANVTMGTVGSGAELGALTVKAGTLTLNGNISVDGGGAVDLSAVPLVVLGANVVIDTDKANAGATAGGDILFGAASTINGDVAGRTLTLDASASDTGGVFAHLAGNVSLGVVGASTGLGALTVIATTATLNGNISVDGGGAVDLQRVGAVVLGGNVTIDTDRADAGTTAGGNILFGNATTINGNATGRTLTLDTSATDTGGAANTAGSVNLGVLGNTTELGALTVKAGTLTLNNNISVDGGGAVNLAGVATVILANNVVIDTDKANAGVTPAGDILFGTAVIKGDAAGRALTLDARRQDDLGVDGIGANITLGTLAATPLLGGLTVKGNQLTLNGNISVDGGTGLNFSQVSTVVLGNNVTLDTDALGTGGDAGAISFGTTPVNGAFALTLDTTADMGGNAGNVSLGTVGAGTELAALTVKGNQLTLNGNISVNGGGAVDLQNVGTVVLGANVTIDTDKAGGTTAAGNILFGGSTSRINGDGVSPRTLTLDATADGGGAAGDVSLTRVGTDVELGALTVKAGTATLNGNIAVDGGGAVNFANAGTVVLATNVIIDTDAAAGSTQAGDILFGSAVIKGDGVLARTLTLDARRNTSSSSGADITLGTLDATPLLGGLTVFGNQLTLNGNISVDGGTGLDFTQVSKVVLGNSVTLDTDALGSAGNAGAITFGSAPLNGAFALTLNTTADMGGNPGNVTLGKVGDTQPLASLTIVAGLTTGAGATVTFGDDVTTSGAGGQSVTAGTIDMGGIRFGAGANPITWRTDTLTGTPNSLSGSTITLTTRRPGDTIGVADATKSLNITDTFMDKVTGTGTVQIGDAANTGGITIATDAAITQNNNIIFRTAGDTVLNSHGITTTSSGVVSFDNFNTAGTTASGGLTLNGNINADGGVAQAGATGVTIGGAGTRTITTSAGNVSFANPVTLNQAFSVSTSGTGAGAGDIAFMAGVNGAKPLTLDAGSANAALASVGNTAELTSLTVTANQLTLNGNISVDGGGAVDLQNVAAVVLGANVTIDTDKASAGTTAGGNILFGNATTINGNAAGRTLTLDASATDTGGAANTAGNVNLGLAGNSTELGGLTVNAGTLTLNGNIAVDGGGAVDFSAAPSVVLGANVTIDTDKANAGTTVGGNILFGAASTINGSAAGRTLTLNASATDAGGAPNTGGNVNLGTVGNATELGALAASGGKLTLNGNVSVNGGGAVDLSGASAVVLANDVTIDTDRANAGNTAAGNILFGTAAIKGDGVLPRTLTLDATATNTGGAAGTSANITLGTIDAAPLLAGLTVKGNQLTLNGNISVNGAPLDFTQMASVVLGNNVTLDTDATGSAGSAGAINFGSVPINGGFTLTLDTTADLGGAAGNVTLGTVGLTTELAGLTMKGSQLTLNGNIAVDGGGAVDLQNVAAVVLGANVTIDTDKANAGTTAGGNILFGNATTINGDGTPRTLTLDASATNAGGAANTKGNVNLGPVGNSFNNEPGALTVNANQLTLNGDVRVSDAASFVNLQNVAAVVLAADVTIDTDRAGVNPGGNILFGATTTINGDGVAPRSLTLDATGSSGPQTGGDVVLGAIGNTTELRALTVRGDQLTLNGDIRVDGAGALVDFSQTSGIVLAGTTLTIDTDKAGAGTTAGGNVLFLSLPFVSPVTGNGKSLVIDTSATDLGGAPNAAGNVALSTVGSAGAPLASLTVIAGLPAGGTGGTVTLSGAVNTSGAGGQSVTAGAISAGSLDFDAGPNPITWRTDTLGASVPASVNASIFTVTTRRPADTIGVEDATKNLKITNPFLASATDGTILQIGDSANTGGITIATDTTVSQFNSFIFRTAGNTVVNGNGILATGGPLTFNNFDAAGVSASGALTLNGDLFSNGAISQVGATGVTISGTRSITTTGDAVSFANGVTLANPSSLSIDTTAGGSTGGANITFSGTLNGATAGGQNLTLTAGTTGDVLFSQAVGGGVRVGDVVITNAENVTEQGGITAKSLTQSAGSVTGTTLLNGAVDTSGTNAGGVNGVALATAGAITVNNTVTTTGGGEVKLANGQLLTLNGNIVADGAVAQTGAGVTSVTGTRSITTTGDAVSFATGVTLANPSSLSIDTTAGGSTGGANITFSGTLNGATAGGQNLTLNAGTTGDVLFSQAVGGGVRVGDVVITNAENVIEPGGITAKSLTQSAGSVTGTTLLNGAVNTNGTNAGGVNGVALTTAGAITVNNTVTTTGGGEVTLNNGSLLTITPAGDMNLSGAFTQNGTGAVHTAGDITTAAGGIGFLRAVTLIGDVMLSAGASGGITFSSTVDGAFGLTANTSGSTTFTSAVGGATPLAFLTTNANGTTFVNGGTVNTSGSQSFGDNVVLGTDTTFHATDATARVAFGGALSAGLNTLTVIADEIDFTGSVSGQSTLVLEPHNPSAAIKLGAAAGGNPGSTDGALDLSTADIAALNPGGFSSIRIGKLDGTPVSFTIDGATFSDPVTLRTLGSMVINGAGITGLDNASIALYARSNAGAMGIAINGPVTAAPNQDVTLSSNGVIGGNGVVTARSVILNPSDGFIVGGGIGDIDFVGKTVTPLTLNVDFIDVQNEIGHVVLQNAKSITLQGHFTNNAPGKELRLTTLNGSILSNAAVQSNNGRIALIANDAGAGGNITIGAGGILSTGGEVALHAADTITVNGAVDTGGANLRMIAGTGPGIDTAHALFQAPNPPVATEAADDIGMITINAPVSVGAGNIVLVTSANGTTGTNVGGIVQSPFGALLGTGTLTAVALRGAGGVNAGGAPIALDQAGAPGSGAAMNSISAVNLFACAYVGCVGPEVPNPLWEPTKSAPFIKEIASLRNGGKYGDGPISYTSDTGASIMGIGTVNDLTFFTPGDYTLAALPLSGRILTLESDGKTTIQLAAPITNLDIAAGGALRIVSGGDINYLSTPAGTIGTAAQTFDRELSFRSAGNIILDNAIYLGIPSTPPPPGGLAPSLILNANQNISTINFSKAATGTGSVTMSGNHEIRVAGGDLTVNGVDLKILGGDTGSANQNATGQLLNVGGTLNVNVTRDVVLKPGAPSAGSSGAVTIQAGSINIGSAATPVKTLTFQGGSGAAGVSMTAVNDASLFVTGDVALTGGAGGSASIVAGQTLNVSTPGNVKLTAGTGSKALLQGTTVNLGAAGAPVRSLSLFGGDSAGADSRIAASGTANLFVSGDVTLAGNAGGSAIIDGGNLNVGTAAAPVSNLSLAGGTLSNARISGTKDVNVFASGSVDLAGGTGGAVTIEGVNVNVGSESAPTHSLSLTAGETILNVALSDARITASKTVNVFATGDVGLTGGSASAAMIEGTTVNIGSAGVPVQKLSLTGGSSPTGGTTVSHKSDAGIVATGDLAAHVAGNLGLTGGATDIVPGAGIFTTATALAKLQGENVLLDVRGNLVMKGGAAKAQNGGNTADSSVGIIATSSFNPASRIAGDLTIQGGTAEATPAAGASSNAQSTATLDVGGILMLNVGHDLSVLGGTAKADTTQGGAEALANATASLLSVGRKEIVVGHDFTVTGGSASTVGSNTKATALAGTDESKTGPDSAFTSTLFITTGGIMSVTGGEESAAGIAAAAILASAEIKLNAGGGLRLSGGSGSGLFQTLPGANKLLELEGRGFPITITGAISKITGLNLGDAFFLSGSPPLTLTDPALLRALDCVAISGGSCVLPASGSRAGDPSKLATGGTCK